MIRMLGLFVGLLLASACSEARSLTLAVPEGPGAKLAKHLARVFEAESGIQVSVSPLTATDRSRAAKGDPVEALLIPERLELAPAASEQVRVFTSDIVLVGTRADRARVRGSNDIRKALSWIANAHGAFVASSPQFGIRKLELALWDEIGVNVRARPSWYTEVQGDESEIINEAAAFGSYALVERATWAGMPNKRGLEILASGDPLLQTDWTSVLLQPAAANARAWHEWLRSETGRKAIAEFQLNGVSPFTPIETATGIGSPSPGRS